MSSSSPFAPSCRITGRIVNRSSDKSPYGRLARTLQGSYVKGDARPRRLRRVRGMAEINLANSHDEQLRETIHKPNARPLRPTLTARNYHIMPSLRLKRCINYWRNEQRR